MGQDGARREIRHAFHPSGASGVSIPGSGWGKLSMGHVCPAIFPYNCLEIRKNRVNTLSLTRHARFYRDMQVVELLIRGVFLPFASIPPFHHKPGRGMTSGPHEYVRPARSTRPLFPVTIRRCGMACAYAESSVGFPGVP